MTGALSDMSAPQALYCRRSHQPFAATYILLHLAYGCRACGDGEEDYSQENERDNGLGDLASLIAKLESLNNSMEQRGLRSAADAKTPGTTQKRRTDCRRGPLIPTATALRHAQNSSGDACVLCLLSTGTSALGGSATIACRAALAPTQPRDDRHGVTQRRPGRQQAAAAR